MWEEQEKKEINKERMNVWDSPTTKSGIQSKVTYGNRFQTIPCIHKQLTIPRVSIAVFSTERKRLLHLHHCPWEISLRIRSESQCSIVVSLQIKLNSWNFKLLYTEIVRGSTFCEGVHFPAISSTGFIFLIRKYIFLKGNWQYVPNEH
jgi:hypothetical protein